MVKKIAGNVLVQLFSILWAVYLFLDYINHSQYLIKAFQYIEYTDLIVTIFLLTAVFVYLFSKAKKWSLEPEIKNFRGIYHYLFVLLLMFLTVLFYVNKTAITSGALASAFTFIFKAIFFHLELGIILFAALSIGSYLLERLQIMPEKNTSVLISIGLGFFIIGTGLFLLGAINLLYPLAVFPFLILLMIPYRKKSLSLLKELFITKTATFKVHILAILAYVFIILLLAINLVAVIRTFPIGYDGLNLYMNAAQLISGYHGLVDGGDAYNWSLLMSLGHILYDNTVVAILISIIPGILSIFAIYRICLRLNVNRNWSLFAATLFYSLPDTIWLSRNEEKTDLALLFISLCAILLLVEKTSAPNTKKPPIRLLKLFQFSPDAIVWAVCGCLIGFGFGIKYLAMLNIFALLVWLFYTNVGKLGAIAIFFLNFAVIYGLDLTRFAAFKSDLLFLRFIIPMSLGLIVLVFALVKNRPGMILAFKKSFIFLFVIGLTFLPWAIKHIAENKTISVDNILTGKSPLPSLYPETLTSKNLSKVDSEKSTIKPATVPSRLNYASLGFSNLLTKSSDLLTELTSEKNSPKKIQSTGEEQAQNYTNQEKEEEIRRHLGYESGIIRFISLPYDLVMKINVNVAASDTGILLLILLPILMFVSSFRQLAWNVLKMILLLLFLIVAIHSVQVMHGPFDFTTAMNSIYTNSFSEVPGFKSIFLPVYAFMRESIVSAESALMPAYDYLTTQSLGMCFILISLFGLPLYFLYRAGLSGMSPLSKSFVLFIYCVLQYWIVLSSGIIWYGIVGFSLVPVLISVMATNENPNSYNNKFTKSYIAACLSIWFILILPLQFTPLEFIYTKDVSKMRFKEFIDPHFMKYAVGAKNEREVFGDFFNPQQKNIINTLNRDKKARILNVATFLNYFIANNDSRVYKDNQLGIFQGIYNNAGNDKNKFATELKKTKIRYVLVSLQTADIDITPDKSLTKKFNDLMQTLVNNPEIQLLYTDRLMERWDGDLTVGFNGQKVKAKYDVLGSRVIKGGTNALFEIL